MYMYVQYVSTIHHIQPELGMYHQWMTSYTLVLSQKVTPAY